MTETAKKWGAADQLAIAVPMIGLIALWFAFAVAQYVGLYEQFQSNFGQSVNYVRWSTWAFLVGIILLGASSLIGRRLAHSSPETRLAKSARGFTLIAVIVSLISGAVFGIGTFMSNFNSWNYQQVNQLIRLANVYGPIIVDAAFLVGLILFAFVLKGGDEDDE